MKNIQTKYKLNFKTMKKGLLTVLAASLVFVGCQNYDDQFDDLNAQISALKSQVDGLSSLSGQVASLSGTIAGLQSGIAAAQAAANAAGTAATAAGASADAATAAVNAIPEVDLSGLSASLTTLQAEIDLIEAQIASTATAAEVAALQTSLTAVEADLADLLVSNNVYSTAITVNSAASMASALALGNKVALMNAAVTITDDATIADTDIQTFIDRIKTMNGTFTYSSGSATGYAATFNELTAATVLDITQAGAISATKLVSATVVTITTSYSTKITGFDMGALTSVTSIASGTDGSETSHTLALSSATNVDLGALARYGSAFTITTKKGATLDIAALDDKDAAGLQSNITLTLNGPASYTNTLIEDGEIDLTNVAAATVSAFYGTIDVNAGVETLTTTDAVTIDLDGATDLVTGTLDYKYDWDPDLTAANAAIAAAGYSTTYLDDYATSASIAGTDLKTLTITGDLLDLYLDEANLETLSINANMTDLTIATATDLTTLTIVSGAKIGSISVTGSNNLLVADFNHTTNLENKGSATANKSASFVVTDNLGLTTLHSTGDKVHTFTVTGNDALTSIDFTGLATRGTETTGGTINLWDNDLTATKATNTADAETATATTGADGGTADVGTFDDGTSGMDSMKIYLTAIAADALNTAQVNFDTVSTEDDTETTGTTTTTLNIIGATSSTTTTNEATVLKMTPVVAGTANTAAGAYSAVAARKGWIAAAATTTIKFNTANEAVTIPASAYTLLGNNAVDAANIASTANKALATTLGLTLDAYNKGNSYSTVSLVLNENTNVSVQGERYTTVAAATAASTATRGTDGAFVHSVGLSDTVTLSVGANSVTTSLNAALLSTGKLAYTGTATTVAAIEIAVRAAWGAKYGTTGTASAAAIATLTGTTNGIIQITMLQADSGGHDKAVTFSVADSGTAVSSHTASNLDYVIGSTVDTGDNSTVATTTGKQGLIITLTSNDAGTNINNTSAIVDASVGASLTALSTDYTSNTTWSKAGLGTGQTIERTDVRTAEDAVAAATSNAVAATAAVLFNRVTWLG
jgi:hypothetical protein